MKATITTDANIKLAAEGKPTLATFSEWQLAFDFFNTMLFSGELPDHFAPPTEICN
jgi:hypothetical protein